MDFIEVIDQVIDLLRQRGRVTYRTVKLQFNLDDEHLDALKEEILYSQPQVIDDDGRGLIWTGESGTAPEAGVRHQLDAELRLHALLPDIIARLQREKRVTYRTLKDVFAVDDTFLQYVRKELALRRLAIDEDGEVLVWKVETQPLITEVAAPSNGPTAPPEARPIDAQQDEQAVTTESSRAVPEAERRQLTVMFCDLADSTKLSQQLDPEDLREVIRAYQESAAEVIHQYEGHMAQYLGDGLLIYFGWPIAHENDAQRALHASLGIVDAITSSLNPHLQQQKGVQLTVRIGIHTGPVVVGEMGGGGRHENLATGETVNIAARLEGLAAPNTVLVSGVTERLVRGVFALESMGLQELKGVAEPMEVFHVLQAMDSEREDDAGLPDEGVFLVGRDEEVGILTRRWEQAKGRLGQVVLISGEAGIGKSSLVGAVRHHVAQEGYTRMTFRCSPFHTNSALYPVIDHVQRVLGFQPGDTPETRLTKLEGVLGGYSRPLDEVVPLYAALLSLPLPEGRYPARNMTPQQQRQQTQDALVGWLLEEAERHPTLALWEDLHWADPSTLEMLGLMLEQTPTVPLLSVLTFRPAFQPSWPTRSHLTSIALNRLEHQQVEALIIHLTNGKTLPEEVIEHLVAKTDGVPLFVEEMTKMLLASELLCEAADGYVLTGPLLSVTIPYTLQDSLMARLDRLDTAKEVAQLGAVLGREFSYEIIKAISLQDEHVLQAGLAQLVKAELLYQRGRPPQAKYIFKHALIQDAAYSSLLRSTQQQHHRQIAELLEARFSETVATQPELVAHHYTEAGCHEQAVAYWQQAGQSALERSANAEAVSHLTRGLEVLMQQPDTPERAHRELVLHIALGGPLIATKGYGSPEIARSTTRARELVEQVGDSEQRFPLLYRQWVYHLVLPDCQTTRTLAEEFLNHAERQGDDALVLMGHRILGVTQFSLGELTDARDHLEQALSLYDPQQHRTLAFRFAQDPQVACQLFLSLVLWLLGYPQQAMQLSHDALANARALEHINTLAYALFYGGELLALFRHHIEDVERHTQALLALSEEQGLGFWGTYATAIDGWTQTLRGNREHGLRGIVKGVADLQATGAAYFHSFLLALQAEAYAENGQALEGLRLLDEALTLVDATDERVWEAEMYRLAGELLQSSGGDGRWEEWTPEACLQKAIDITRLQQAKSLELRAATSLAHLWQSQGKRREAYDLLAPVYGWFTEGFDTADLKDAKALLEEIG